jgi:hypothetical protein
LAGKILVNEEHAHATGVPLAKVAAADPRRLARGTGAAASSCPNSAPRAISRASRSVAQRGRAGRPCTKPQALQRDAAIRFRASMAAYPEPSDWRVLSELLRFARRDGWQIAFLVGRVEITRAAALPGVVTFPGAILGEARQAGWSIGRAPQRTTLVLRHPAVHQRVDLILAA